MQPSKVQAVRRHIEMIPPVRNNQKQTKKKVSDPFVFQSLEVILKLITIVEALDIVKIFIVESIVLKIVELRTLIPVMPWKYLKFVRRHGHGQTPLASLPFCLFHFYDLQSEFHPFGRRTP